MLSSLVHLIQTLFYRRNVQDKQHIVVGLVIEFGHQSLPFLFPSIPFLFLFFSFCSDFKRKILIQGNTYCLSFFPHDDQKQQCEIWLERNCIADRKI
jgi:hypothetical protein